MLWGLCITQVLLSRLVLDAVPCLTTPPPSRYHPSRPSVDLSRPAPESRGLLEAHSVSTCLALCAAVKSHFLSVLHGADLKVGC